MTWRRGDRAVFCAHSNIPPASGGCAGFPLQRRRKARAETKLPSGEKTEGAGEKGTPAGKAATSVIPPEHSRRERSGWHGGRGRIRGSARAKFREQNMRLAPGSPAATRQGRIDQLRRDRAAALAVRAAFPGLQQLRLEL